MSNLVSLYRNNITYENLSIGTKLRIVKLLGDNQFLLSGRIGQVITVSDKRFCTVCKSEKCKDCSCNNKIIEFDVLPELIGNNCHYRLETLSGGKILYE